MPDPNSKRTFRTVIVDMRSNGNFVYVSQDAPQKNGGKKHSFLEAIGALGDYRFWCIAQQAYRNALYL